MLMDRRQPPPQTGLGSAPYLLGFALGGFFDGILLHQILQWHHLLSGLENDPFDDPRIQILADGLFHAAMYVIALIGLWLLVRRRNALLIDGAGRRLLAAMLIGFGTWHILDAVLSHWLLGLHRIRVAPPGPLFWDLLWLGVFGLLPLLIGLWLQRIPSPRERRHIGSARLSIVVAVVTAAALVSLLDPFNRGSDSSRITVVLRPDTTAVPLLTALHAADGRIVASAGKGTVWVLELPREVNRWEFYRYGALLVSGTGLPAGCAAWLR